MKTGGNFADVELPPRRRWGDVDDDECANKDPEVIVEEVIDEEGKGEGKGVEVPCDEESVMLGALLLEKERASVAAEDVFFDWSVLEEAERTQTKKRKVPFSEDD